VARLIRSLLRHTRFAQHGQLVSLDDPYAAIARLLEGHSVTGILDAGASNGRITKKLLTLFPHARAYAFEPNPSYRDALERDARADGRIRPQFLALADTEGTADLHITQSPGTTSLFVPNALLRTTYPAGSTVQQTVRVETVTIDGWSERHGHPELHLMKFDIQGGELRALIGGTKTLERSTLLLYTEILLNPLYEGGALFAELDLFLRKTGFVLHNIYKPRCDPQGRLLWGNAIYVHAERLHS
jgi:FkbM family methyltransferase